MAISDELRRLQTVLAHLELKYSLKSREAEIFMTLQQLFSELSHHLVPFGFADQLTRIAFTKQSMALLHNFHFDPPFIAPL